MDGNNYNPETSHVLPALIKKFHEAKLNNDDEVVVWGDGSPLREFMHCDDLADALVFITKLFKIWSINIGTGQEISIKKLADIIADIVGYKPRTKWDKNKA